MYKCESCGHLFEEGEEKRWTEMHGFEGGNGENWSGCPICGESYEEIEPCKICGSYDRKAEEDFCEECKIDVQKRFQTFVKNEFTTEERELLNELYDGEPI
jgi:hypothetical protein